MKPLQILLALYNSAAYLRTQLDSILTQDYRDFEVLIRDGGSTDETVELAAEYCRREPERLRYLGSSPAGARENFSRLLAASEAPLLMFADHDDFWLPDKISRSLEAMRGLEARYGADTPLLVFTDSMVADRNLNVIAPSMLKYQHLSPERLTLRDILIQNVISGNTMLFNRALADLAAPIPDEAVMHDHWLALTAAAFGHTAFVENPTLLYRQHGANIFGASRYSLGFMLHKFRDGRKQVQERFLRNIRQAQAFGRRYAERLTPEDRAMFRALDGFETLSVSGKYRLLRKYGIRKHGFLRNLGLFWGL